MTRVFPVIEVGRPRKRHGAMWKLAFSVVASLIASIVLTVGTLAWKALNDQFERIDFSDSLEPGESRLEVERSNAVKYIEFDDELVEGRPPVLLLGRNVAQDVWLEILTVTWRNPPESEPGLVKGELVVRLPEEARKYLLGATTGNGSVVLVEGSAAELGEFRIPYSEFRIVGKSRRVAVELFFSESTRRLRLSCATWLQGWSFGVEKMGLKSVPQVLQLPCGLKKWGQSNLSR